MGWFCLVVAGLFEVCWAVGLKFSHGFTHPASSIVTVVFLCASFLLLAFALRTIPLGTGYAVWTGIGTIGAAILGMFLFGEPVSAARIIFILMILAGIMGLKLTAQG